VCLFYHNVCCSYLFLKIKINKFVLGIFLIAMVFVLHTSFFQPSRWFEMSDHENFLVPYGKKQLTG